MSGNKANKPLQNKLELAKDGAGYSSSLSHEKRKKLQKEELRGLWDFSKKEGKVPILTTVLLLAAVAYGAHEYIRNKCSLPPYQIDVSEHVGYKGELPPKDFYKKPPAEIKSMLEKFLGVEISPSTPLLPMPQLRKGGRER
jgi:hypothetical protein